MSAVSFVYELLAGVCVGLAGGLTSGLLGVSPGGGLVIFSVLLLGAEQHVAQGTSLIAQVPPTSLAGIRRYWQEGTRSPVRWIVLLSAGFLAGSILGGYAAAVVTRQVLQWAYVLYLSALVAALLLRRESKEPADAKSDGSQDLRWFPLSLVGTVAGFASGFMGIGGGLAVTVGLTAGLRVPQHQAQLVSLVFSVVPVTIPAAWIYWSKGLLVSWTAVAGILAGLWLGTDLGARLAMRATRRTLRRVMVASVSAMALYMTYKALS